MANIIDYIKWRGDLTFEQAAWNEVDAVVLARFSYLPLTGLVEGDFMHPIAIHEVTEQFLRSEDLKAQTIYPDDIVLAELMGKSRRFGDLELTGYADQLDEAEQKQFSAMTIYLGNEACVVYRGTDRTFTGWREDCNMAFLSTVPSQRTAQEYLRHVAEQFNGRMFLCGHSKGGNLAIYAAATCGENIQDRIYKVYSMDGPGFESDILTDPGYERMLPKITTYIPQKSIVGMMFEHRENYVVIRSAEDGLMQHDVYSWEVLGPSLVHEEDITEECRLINESIKEWIETMDANQRRQFIDTIFELIDTCDAKTTDELQNRWYKEVGKILTSIKKMDEDSRKMVSQTLLSLVRITRKKHMDSRDRKGYTE